MEHVKVRDIEEWNTANIGQTQTEKRRLALKVERRKKLHSTMIFNTPPNRFFLFEVSILHFPVHNHGFHQITSERIRKIGKRRHWFCNKDIGFFPDGNAALCFA